MACYMFRTNILSELSLAYHITDSQKKNPGYDIQPNFDREQRSSGMHNSWDVSYTVKSLI